MKEHAIIGRQQVALETLNQEYNNLLAALQAVASGQVELSRVTVDLAARTWKISEPLKAANDNPAE